MSLYCWRRKPKIQFIALRHLILMNDMLYRKTVKINFSKGTKDPGGDSVVPASPPIVQAYEWLSYCSNKGRSHYRRHFVSSPCNLSYLHQLFAGFIANSIVTVCAFMYVCMCVCVGGVQAGWHAQSQCHKSLLDAGLRLPCVLDRKVTWLALFSLPGSQHQLTSVPS